MSTFYFSPFPQLVTKNFLLRKLSQNDSRDIFITRSDENVLKYLDIPKAQSIDDAQNFIAKINNGIEQNEWIYWAISYKEDQKLLGTICLWNFVLSPLAADIGFVLLPEFQGKGIMREVVPVVLKYGFEKIHLSKIYGEVAPLNTKSVKLLEQFGFKFEKHLDKYLIYSLINPHILHH